MNRLKSNCSARKRYLCTPHGTPSPPSLCHGHACAPPNRCTETTPKRVMRYAISEITNPQSYCGDHGGQEARYGSVTKRQYEYMLQIGSIGKELTRRISFINLSPLVQGESRPRFHQFQVQRPLHQRNLYNRSSRRPVDGLGHPSIRQSSIES